MIVDGRPRLEVVVADCRAVAEAPLQAAQGRRKEAERNEYRRTAPVDALASR